MELNSRIYIAGHRGMVGSAILRNLQDKGYTNFILRTSTELDLRNQQNVADFFAREKPDFVFYLSGVDVLATDRFGKLKISLEGCRKRDEMVFRTLKQKQLPCVTAMGGGYSPQVKTIVEAHCNTFRLAKDIYNLD